MGIKMRINKEQFAGVTLVFILVALTLIGMYSGTRIDNYHPKSDDEIQIITLVTAFNLAKTNHDLESYLACLDNGGIFMFGGSLMVSKQELKQRLPMFWANRESGYLLTRPSSREELNGNFFAGILYDPVLTITQNRAKAVVTFVTPIIRWHTKLFLEFHKQNGAWLISRFEWDMG